MARGPWVVLAIIGCSIGCHSEMQNAARAQAASDFGCQRGDIELLNHGPDEYRARGCGKSAIYECLPGHRGEGDTTCKAKADSPCASSAPASSAPASAPAP